MRSDASRLGTGSRPRGWCGLPRKAQNGGHAQRRSVAVASLDGVSAAVPFSEGPMPSWRLRAVDRASPSEAAALDQRESFYVVGRLIHQLTRQSSIGLGAHGHESPPRIG
jgi:hypothetical protein